MSKIFLTLSCALLLGVSAAAAEFPIVYTYDTAKPQQAFELNVPVPDGNYLVTLEIGSRKRAARTFVKSESRRLSVNDHATANTITHFLPLERKKMTKKASAIVLEACADGKPYFPPKYRFPSGFCTKWICSESASVCDGR